MAKTSPKGAAKAAPSSAAPNNPPRPARGRPKGSKGTPKGSKAAHEASLPPSQPPDAAAGKGATEDAAAIWASPHRLQPWGRNPRLNENAVPALMHSIRRYGFGAPVVVQARTMRILAGHTRVKAAIALGMERIPVRVLALSDADADAYALADNKFGELAAWDEGKLSEIVADLTSQGFDAADLGWSASEIDAMIADLRSKPPPDLDSPKVRPKPGKAVAALKYLVIVDCADEASQRATLEALNAGGYTVRSVIS